MALVAYDYNSDSGSDNEENNYNREGEPRVNGTYSVSLPENQTSLLHVNNHDTNTGLFNKLPEPKPSAQNAVMEEQDEFLQKKEQPTEEKPQKRKTIKIGVPSLAEFHSDDDEPTPKKSRVSKTKTSGLMAMLPPPKITPKSSTSFVPNVLQKKVTKTTKISKSVPQQVNPHKSSPVIENIKNIAHPGKEVLESDDEGDDFGVPEFDDEEWQKVCGRQKHPPRPAKKDNLSSNDQNGFIPVIEPAPEASKPYSGLDNQAFKELVGSNSRRKMNQNIDLIDIHEDEIMPDKQDWLKSLTDPNCEAAPAVTNPVDTTRKVKNHITSLAQKALANDKELQMRWAESRHNRTQSRAKYGF